MENRPFDILGVFGAVVNWNIGSSGVLLPAVADWLVLSVVVAFECHLMRLSIGNLTRTFPFYPSPHFQ